MSMDQKQGATRYNRTGPWSIEANGRTYSIAPWKFESVWVDVLDLHISVNELTNIENDSFFDDTSAISIQGKVKFPKLGFIGNESNPDSLLTNGEFLIFPIDDESIGNEFEMGTQHVRSTLGEFRSEFDNFDKGAIDEIFGNPHSFGVCRLRDGFLRIYTNRIKFRELALGMKYGQISRLKIKLKLYNLYSDGEAFFDSGSFTDDYGQLKKKLFLFQESETGYSEYMSHGIVESFYLEFRLFDLKTLDGFAQERGEALSLRGDLIEKIYDIQNRIKLIRNFTIFIFIISILLMINNLS